MPLPQRNLNQLVQPAIRRATYNSCDATPRCRRRRPLDRRSLSVSPAGPATGAAACSSSSRTAAACTEAVVLIRGGGDPRRSDAAALPGSRRGGARVLPGLHARSAVALTEPDRRDRDTGQARLRRAADRHRVVARSNRGRPPHAATRRASPSRSSTRASSLHIPSSSVAPGTETLNEQEPAPIGGVHGTAVASLIGAPANGLGIVGVYPEALLRSWDAAKGEGTQLETTEIARGILAAANAGPGVVNLSIGSDRKEVVIEQAVYQAVQPGQPGRRRIRQRRRPRKPAGVPGEHPACAHGRCSDPGNGVAPFSSRSRFVDLVAPGPADRSCNGDREELRSRRRDELSRRRSSRVRRPGSGR